MDVVERNKLIEANDWVVAAVINNYHGKYRNVVCKYYEDISQRLFYKLCMVADKFNEDLNCKFSTYAYLVLRGEIRRELRFYLSCATMPIVFMDRLDTISEFTDEYIKENQCFPTSIIIANALNTSSDRIAGLLGGISYIPFNTVGFWSPETEDGDDISYDQYSDAEYDDQENKIVDFYTVQQIYDIIENDLGERERLIIYKRFGLFEEQEHTLEEIGEQLGLSGERIRQILEGSLFKMRKIFNKKTNNPVSKGQ